jgi:phosphatidylserine/phosphatidylglycerophosphate/cardiolipin synthase-like enzyme
MDPVKKYIPLVLFIVFVLAAAYVSQNFRRLRMPEKLPPINVYFSPKGGCTDAIVQEIEAAKESILVQAYSFTSKPIAAALADAHKRGVRVEAILDSDQVGDAYSEIDSLVRTGIPTQIDTEHSIAHNKVMVIDGGVVITGSFNFTHQAEKSNAENLLIIRDNDISKAYTDNWNAHAAHSRVYRGQPKEGGDSAHKPAKSRQGNSKELEKGIERTMKSLLN